MEVAEGMFGLFTRGEVSPQNTTCVNGEHVFEG